MDRETAYRVMMAFARNLKVPCSMKRMDENRWQVRIEPAGSAVQVLTDLGAARAVYARLRNQLRLPL